MPSRAAALFLLFFLLLSWVPGDVTARQAPERRERAASIKVDTDPVSIRPLSPALVKRYQTDPDYQYGRSSEARNWRERINRWLYEHLVRPLFRGTQNQWFTWFIRILAAAAVVWAFYRLYRLADQPSPFAQREKVADSTRIEEVVDVASVDFDELIEAALSRGEARSALRYCYLKALQLLQARDVLTWKPGKTNSEYLAEVRRKAPAPIASELADLTRLYEYVWYGEFPIAVEKVQATRSRITVFGNGAEGVRA